MLLLAVTRAIEIVGEAASQISPQLRRQRPGIPWTDIVGMRNRLIHAYFDVNRDILWTTATELAPALLAEITALEAAVFKPDSE